MKDKKVLFFYLFALLPFHLSLSSCVGKGYELVWSDEFNTNGRLSADWTFEQGFQRNNELQWYQPQNAWVEDGCLVIEARREQVPNPIYREGSSDWRRNRRQAEYTSACVTTQGRREFRYGRFEVRAKIPTTSGAWPAIWLLGHLRGGEANRWEWPQNGEIDMLEYYIKNGQPSILANVCWGGKEQWMPVWRESVKPFSHFIAKDSLWAEKFHVWRMDWTPRRIRLYVDDELLNDIDLRETQNQGFGGNTDNPFSNSVPSFGHYILLNLAIGSNGGTPDNSQFPLRYLVDYVRVYKKGKSEE